MTIKKNAVAGDYMFGCQDDKTLISMITKKKKAVLVLSTMHDTDTVNDVTQKPTQIMDYNSTKGGVDTVDLMCSRISTSRRTQRWPVTIFFRLLDLAGINSLRIFQWNTAHVKVIRRRIYIKQLALNLISENLIQQAQLKHLPRDLTVFLETYKEGQESSSSSNQFVHQPAQSIRRGICYICGSRKNNRTRQECKGCGKNVCKQHSNISVTCDLCHQTQGEDSDMDVD